MADKAADMEKNWTDITGEGIAKFLTAYYDKRRVDETLPPDRAPLVTFLLAANLPSSCREEGEWWFNHLDRVEGAIEATR